MHRPHLPPLALAALALALTLALPSAALPRSTILYEVAPGHRALTGPQPGGGAGLGTADGAYQQQPAVRLLPEARQVAKVSGRGGSPSSPTLLGRGAPGMADLLRERIGSFGAGWVSIDELSGEFRGPEGDALGAALTELAAEAGPDGAGTMAERVHVYVPAPATLVAQGEAYAGAWDALIRAGGVWIETYRGARAWSDEEWAAWPGLFREEYVRRRGDPTRLHLVLTAGDQARQWARARTGAACELLANGPGAYRVGPAGAAAFVAEFRATFPPGPAPAGPSPVACVPPPAAPAAAVARLAGAARTREAVAARWDVERLWAGIRSRGVIDLGPDPLGLAGALELDPAAFWSGAGAAVVGVGEGTRTRAPVRADGTARVSMVPGAPGPVSFRLIVPGAAIRTALGTPSADLPGALASAGAPADLVRRMRISPRTWRLEIPLRPPADALWSTVAEDPPTPDAGPATAALARAGAGRVRRAGRDPRRWSLFVLRLTAADGRPVPRARARVGRPWMAPVMHRTTPDGLLAIWVPRRSGQLEVRVPRWSPPARRNVEGRPPGTIRLDIRIAGARATRAAGRDPARWRLAVVRARGPRGQGAGVPLRVTGTGGGMRRVRTGPDGRARIFVRARRGVVRARVVGTRREAVRRA